MRSDCTVDEGCSSYLNRHMGESILVVYSEKHFSNLFIVALRRGLFFLKGLCFYNECVYMGVFV